MGSKNQKNKHNSQMNFQNKNLVTDQPGLKVLMAGVLVSLVLSLLIKGLTQSSKIQNLVESAASHIHKDLKVKVGTANMSYADGILPRIAVVIKDIILESNQSCWLSPEMKIDELVLPLSLSHLLQGKIEVTEVIANNIDLELRSSMDLCKEQFETLQVSSSKVMAKNISDKNSEIHSNLAKEPSQSKVVFIDKKKDHLLDNSQYLSIPKGSLREIYIHQLKVIYQPLKQYPMTWVDINLTSPYGGVKELTLKAKTQMIKEEIVGDYLSHSNLILEYKEEPFREANFHFFGHLREGYYSINANLRPEEKTFQVNSEIKHIPFNLIISQLRKLGLSETKINGRQVWISLQSHIQGETSDIKKSHGSFQNIKFEGDVADVGMDRIEIKNLDPFRYDPFDINIRRLNLSKFIQSFNQRPPSQFADMGSFQGSAHWSTDEDIQLQGEVNGLQLIFINKGRRELQEVNHITTTTSLKKNIWSFQISRMDFEQGLFNGEFNLKSNKDFTENHLTFHGEDISLSPQVSKLLTQNGIISPIHIEGDFEYNQNVLKKAKATLKAEKVEVEGVLLNDFVFHLDTLKNEYVAKASLNRFYIPQKNSIMKFLNPVIATNSEKWLDEQKGFELSKFSMTAKSKDFQSINWDHFSGVLIDKSKFSSEGGWDSLGHLFGYLHIKSLGKEIFKWRLVGDRDNPLLNEH